MHTSQLQYDNATPREWDEPVMTLEECEFSLLTVEQQAEVEAEAENFNCSIDEALRQLKDINAI